MAVQILEDIWNGADDPSFVGNLIGGIPSGLSTYGSAVPALDGNWRTPFDDVYLTDYIWYRSNNQDSTLFVRGYWGRWQIKNIPLSGPDGLVTRLYLQFSVPSGARATYEDLGAWTGNPLDLSITPAYIAYSRKLIYQGVAGYLLGGEDGVPINECDCPPINYEEEVRQAPGIVGLDPELPTTGSIEDIRNNFCYGSPFYISRYISNPVYEIEGICPSCKALYPDLYPEMYQDEDTGQYYTTELVTGTFYPRGTFVVNRWHPNKSNVASGDFTIYLPGNNTLTVRANTGHSKSYGLEDGTWAFPLNMENRPPGQQDGAYNGYAEARAAYYRNPQDFPDGLEEEQRYSWSTGSGTEGMGQGPAQAGQDPGYRERLYIIIHPDGNGPATLGCIGIWPEDDLRYDVRGTLETLKDIAQECSKFMPRELLVDVITDGIERGVGSSAGTPYHTKIGNRGTVIRPPDIGPPARANYVGPGEYYESRGYPTELGQHQHTANPRHDYVPIITPLKN